MHKEILINVEPEEKRVAVVENGRLVEFYIEQNSKNPIVGNIYKGIVHSVVPGINAAFINIGLSRNGFLYLSDVIEPPKEFEDTEVAFEDSFKEKGPQSIERLLKKGEQVLVQVVKEALGTKGPRLTTHISFPGRYLVLMPVDRHIGISKRIEDPAERSRLKRVLKTFTSGANFGVIARTAAIGKQERDFRRELRFLLDLWRRINSESKRKIAPSLIHQEYTLIQRILRDIFTEDVEKVFVDDKDEFRRIIGFARTFLSNLKNRIFFYRGRLPLFESKGVEKDIERLFERKIFLKCGGYIVIEQTEGMVAIDVNSGHFRRQQPEETALKVNLEAAEELARQIMLRNLGGIIVIDFIDMEKEEHNKMVYNKLVDMFKRDKAKLNISRLSEFGIVEMTRQRTRQDVIGITHQNCPYCSGKGFVKSPMTMGILVLRSIRSQLEARHSKVLRIFAHIGVAHYLLNENRTTISSIENCFRTKIEIVSESNMHIEEFRVERG